MTIQLDRESVLTREEEARLLHALEMASRQYRGYVGPLTALARADEDNPIITRDGAAQMASLFESYADQADELAERMRRSDGVAMFRLPEG